jgi:NAD(P)-dependent dehydrogenase (short-subunit alcohol dehydrogenase family)
MTKRKSVVVTGASTGIGRGCVKVLTAAGFHVFGSVRKPTDAGRLARGVRRQRHALAVRRHG